MKYLIFSTFICCTKHIHHKDILPVKPGMKYEQVIEQLGPPNRLLGTEPIQSPTGEFKTFQTYIWKSHENINDSIKNCYFIFIDNTLMSVKC